MSDKEAFDSALLARLPHEGLDFNICESGEYADEEMQSAWEGWCAAKDHYAPKLTAKAATELLNKVLRNVNEATWMAGRGNIGTAQAQVLRAAGVRFREEA